MNNFAKSTLYSVRLLKISLPTQLTAFRAEKCVQFRFQTSQGVALDPDNLLPPDITSKFRNLSIQYDSVFDPAITGYNGAFCLLQAKVNMGPVEPSQRKIACPCTVAINLSSSSRSSMNWKNSACSVAPKILMFLLSILTRLSWSQSHRVVFVSSLTSQTKVVIANPSLPCSRTWILPCAA